MKIRPVRVQPQRGPLADGAGLLRAPAPDDVRAESAGQDPRREVWPEVVEVMREIGIDLRAAAPEASCTREMQLHADWAVTMACGDDLPVRADHRRGLGHPRPGRQERRRGARIRDEIEQRVQRPDRATASTRSAPTTPPTSCGSRACSRRSSEFDDRRPDAEIRACADAVLSQYADAPVRSFAMTLAHRRTRECLLRESCDMIPA